MMHDRIAPTHTGPASGRYEGREGLDPAASVLVLLITLALLFLLTAQRDAREAERLNRPIEVMNLQLPPPPAPPDTPPPPPVPPPPAAFTPPPLVKMPALAPPLVAAQPVPVPTEPAPTPEPAPPAPPAPPSPPRQVSAGDLSASMIHAPAPRYPRESRRLREQGTVLLTLVLATDGTVVDIAIAKSSGHRRLDDAALAAVRKWRWRPTTRQGSAVQVRGSVEIPFVLTG